MKATLRKPGTAPAADRRKAAAAQAEGRLEPETAQILERLRAALMLEGESLRRIAEAAARRRAA